MSSPGGHIGMQDRRRGGQTLVFLDWDAGLMVVPGTKPGDTGRAAGQHAGEEYPGC